MGNEVNKIFDGLFQGIVPVADALIENNRKSKLSELYSSSLDQLNKLMNPQANYQQNGQDVSRSQVSQDMLNNSQVNTNNPTMQAPKSTVQQTQQPDVKGAMEYLYKQSPEFLNYGEQGKQNLGLLNDFFKGNQKQQPDYDIREVGGQLIRYDKNNPNNFEVVYGEKKPEKDKPRTMSDYQNMTMEDVAKLKPDEIENAFYYLKPEVQDELKKNPYFQQLNDKLFKDGDFAPKLKRGGKIGSYNSPISFGESDKKKFEKLKGYNEDVWAGKQLEPDAQREYEATQKQLGAKYDLNFEQLAKVTEKLQNANSVKEQDKIIESLDKGNYYNDNGTSQEQIDYDRSRVQQWKDYMKKIADTDGYGDNWNTEVAKFRQEFNEYFNRGSLTKKEHSDLTKSY